MPRIRRRTAARERWQEPDDEQRARMHLDREVLRARLYRASPGPSDPSWFRDSQWWDEIGEPAMERRREGRWGPRHRLGQVPRHRPEARASRLTLAICATRTLTGASGLIPPMRRKGHLQAVDGRVGHV